MAIFKPSNLSPNFQEVDVSLGEINIEFQVHTSGSYVNAYEITFYKEFNVEDDKDGEDSIVWRTWANFDKPYTNGDIVQLPLALPSDTFQNEENYRWNIRVYQDKIDELLYVDGSQVSIEGIGDASDIPAAIEQVYPANNYKGYICEIPIAEDPYKFIYQSQWNELENKYEWNQISDSDISDFYNTRSETMLQAINNNQIVPTYVGEGMITGSTRDTIWTRDDNYNIKINNWVECRFNSINSDFNVFKKNKNNENRKPLYYRYYNSDLEDINKIYGETVGNIKCFKIPIDTNDGNRTWVDKKYFSNLTDYQHYIVISSNTDFASDHIVKEIQIQDIIQHEGRSYIVPYNQKFIRNDYRYNAFKEEWPQVPSGKTYYFTIEFRQRQCIFDITKNVGEHNLIEITTDMPFDFSYKNGYSGKLYYSQGLSEELASSVDQRKQQNKIMKTIYINANLQGHNTLYPLSSGQPIEGGWILGGAEDESYSVTQVLQPIQCYIKFGSYETVSSLPTYGAAYKDSHCGEIILKKTDPASSDDGFYTFMKITKKTTTYEWVPMNSGAVLASYLMGDDNTQPQAFNIQSYNIQDGMAVIKVPESFNVNTSQYYALYYIRDESGVSGKSVYLIDEGIIGGGGENTYITSVSAGTSTEISNNGQWIKNEGEIGDVASFDVTTSSAHRSISINVHEGEVYKITIAGDNSARAWSFTDANRVILSVAPKRATYTDEYIVAPPSSSKLVLNNLNAVQAHPSYRKITYTTTSTSTDNPFGIVGYNHVVTSNPQHYYNIFLSPNNMIKPDPYMPIYLEFINDYQTMRGLVINSGTYDRKLSVDTMDDTQYYISFYTLDDTLHLTDDILSPQTKVKIYTQFVDSVPLQYFYARQPLGYNIDVYQVGTNVTAMDGNDITRRDIDIKAALALDINTSNEIRYYRYQLYYAENNAEGEMFFDSGNIYNPSLFYTYRGLPNNEDITIKLTFEDNLGHISNATKAAHTNYPDDFIDAGISLGYGVSYPFTNTIELSGAVGDIYPVESQDNFESSNNNLVLKTTGTDATYNEAILGDQSAILCRLQFNANIFNHPVEDENMVEIINTGDYKVKIDNQPFDTTFVKNNNYLDTTLSYNNSTCKSINLQTFSEFATYNGVIFGVMQQGTHGSNAEGMKRIPIIIEDGTHMYLDTSKGQYYDTSGLRDQSNYQMKILESYNGQTLCIYADGYSQPDSLNNQQYDIYFNTDTGKPERDFTITHISS